MEHMTQTIPVITQNELQNLRAMNHIDMAIPNISIDEIREMEAQALLDFYGPDISLRKLLGEKISLKSNNRKFVNHYNSLGKLGVYNNNFIANKITNDKILFFDMDGTLIDTDYSNFLAYQKAVKSVINKNLTYKAGKRFTRKQLLEIFPGLTKNEIEEIVEKKELYYKDFLKDTKLNKTVYNTLNKYCKTNRTFLVTNSRQNRADLLLRYYGLKEKFEGIYYRRLKKNKRVNKYQSLISELNVSPSKIIVFENEAIEIKDAISAGIPKENIILIN